MLKSGALNDIEMFENIINSINVSYRKLTELEFKSLKESKEYKEELENLKSCITIEENILERFKVSGDLEEIISYIENKFETKAGININFSCKECDIKKARISNDLHQIRISQILNGFCDQYMCELYKGFLFEAVVLCISLFTSSINFITFAARFRCIISNIPPLFSEPCFCCLNVNN